METNALGAWPAPAVEAEPALEFPLTHARAALARLAPWLARCSATPAHALPGESSEDLAQTVLTSCLARLERCARTSGALPEWCRDEERLRAYLAGALARHHARRWRDHRRAVALPQGLCVRSTSEAREPCPCLRGLDEEERRLLEAEPAERAELARELGLSRATLQKRRTRSLSRLRVRCRSCARRRDGACGWLPLG